MTDDTSPWNENLTGCFLGYDPGGEKGHGVAAIKVASGEVADHRVATKKTVEEALQWFRTWFRKGEPDFFGPVLGIGIDTLTYWSSGWAGWRMADQCLRHAYSEVSSSVASPNGLRGAMCLNGMFVLRRLRHEHGELYVTETHPKVLYYALAEEKYDYGQEMKHWLTEGIPWTQQKGKEIGDGSKITSDEHQWDALISAWAAFCGRSGKWPLNLLSERHCHELAKKRRPEEKWDFPGENAEILEFPFAGGRSNVEYRWPSP